MFESALPLELDCLSESLNKHVARRDFDHNLFVMVVVEVQILCNDLICFDLLAHNFFLASLFDFFMLDVSFRVTLFDLLGFLRLTRVLN